MTTVKGLKTEKDPIKGAILGTGSRLKAKDMSACNVSQFAHDSVMNSFGGAFQIRVNPLFLFLVTDESQVFS